MSALLNWRLSLGSCCVSGLRVELHRGPSCGGVSGPQSGGAEEEIRLQVPQTEGERHRAGVSGQRHLLPQRPQHVCHRYRLYTHTHYMKNGFLIEKHLILINFDHICIRFRRFIWPMYDGKPVWKQSLYCAAEAKPYSHRDHMKINTLIDTLMYWRTQKEK